MSQQGSIGKLNGFWVLRYRVTRPEMRCKVCGQLEKRHKGKDHALDGERVLARTQLTKKLAKVQAREKLIRSKGSIPPEVRAEAEKIPPANQPLHDQPGEEPNNR